MTRSRKTSRRKKPRDKLGTILRVVIPLLLGGVAVYQVLANGGHVDDNIVGALVCISAGGAVGYAVDKVLIAYLSGREDPDA